MYRKDKLVVNGKSYQTKQLLREFATLFGRISNA